MERTSPEFVGRADSLAAVVDRLQDGPSLVFVEGEPGIGKTRLLREALMAFNARTSTDRRASGSHRVLVSACPALGEPFPLGAVVDGVRRMFKSDAAPRLGDLGLSALCGALRPLFPEWAEQLPPALEALDDPKETRHRLFSALSELVERLRIDVLVVEDAHWADAATLEWLLTSTAAEPAPGQRRSIVVSFRPTDVPDGSLLRRLTSRPPAGMDVVRIELEPLDVEQTRRLVASMFHTGAVSDSFAEFLHERTDGVPLAVEECVRLLRDRRDIVRTDGQWSRRALDELEVPPTVRDSVLERVERLHPHVRAVLQAAAVLAGPADERLLVSVAGLDEHAGPWAVAASLASGLLQEVAPGRIVYRHVLDEHAVAESIQASDWRRLHAAAAQALRGVNPEPVVRFARHYKEAGDTETWSHYAEATADLALESGDERAAVSILLDLLTEVEHPVERRTRLARKLGEAAFLGVPALGERTRMVADALRAVLNMDTLPRLERGELQLQLGRMLQAAGEGNSAFEAFEASIPDLDDRPDLAIRAMTNLAKSHTLDWPASQHLHWLDRATELVDRSGSPTEQRLLTAVRATTLLLFGEEEGWNVSTEITAPVPGPKHQRLVDRELLNLAEAMLPWGRYGDARHQLETAVGIVESYGFQRHLTWARLVDAYLDWYTGRWEGLSATASEIATAEESGPSEQLHARQLSGMLDLAAGARPRAERQLREVTRQCASLGYIQPEDLAAPAALGRIDLADGAAEEALRETVPMIDLIARKDVWLWASDIAPVHLQALVGVGRLAEADEFVDQFAAWLGARAVPAAIAAVATCRAILAAGRDEPSKAASLFADASTLWAGLPRPYDELLALEQQGRCLLGAGENERALALLSGAQERLGELGAKWDADRVAQLLRAHGVEVARSWRGGRRGYGDQLSPRELEVVALVARGLTSRQIGEALFLSPKTVDSHLRTAMRKMGVSTRSALAVATADAGLLISDAEESAR